MNVIGAIDCPWFGIYTFNMALSRHAYVDQLLCPSLHDTGENTLIGIKYPK